MAVFKKPKPLMKKEDVAPQKKPPIEVPEGRKKWSDKDQKKAENKKTMPDDKYKKEFDPLTFVPDDWQEIHMYIQRTDDDLGLPRVHLRQYQTTDTYTGYTKKGFSIPLEYLPRLIRELNSVLVEANRKGLTEEVDMTVSE